MGGILATGQVVTEADSYAAQGATRSWPKTGGPETKRVLVLCGQPSGRGIESWTRFTFVGFIVRPVLPQELPQRTTPMIKVNIRPTRAEPQKTLGFYIEKRVRRMFTVNPR